MCGGRAEVVEVFRLVHQVLFANCLGSSGLEHYAVMQTEGAHVLIY